MAHRMLALLVGGLLLGGSGFAAAGTADVASPQPEIFAPGSLSGPAGVDCLTFAPDGNTVFFDQQAGSSGFIMESHRTGDGWSAPRIAPFSGQWLDHDPAMSPDGSFLVFTSNRPDTPDGQPLHGGHLWRVDQHGNGWGSPARLPDAVNDARAIYAPSIAANGDLYYQRLDVATHRFHLYRSAWRDGRYQPPKQLALGDSAAEEQDPAIAPDGSFLVFDANYGAKDQPAHLYIAFRQGDGWSTPVDFGNAVDRYQPWGSHLGPDGRSLYFTSNFTLPAHYPRSPAQARADLARMRAWDNGNNHIWRLSLAPWLASHRAL